MLLTHLDVKEYYSISRGIWRDSISREKFYFKVVYINYIS